MDQSNQVFPEIPIETELVSDQYLDISQMDGIDHSLASTASSSSSDGGADIKPQIREQFDRLANALSDTNHNLHTFEFMLGQYRQMAKISPFLVKASVEAAAGANIMSKSESNLSISKCNEDVIEQLKVLSEAISQMKTSSEEVPASTTTRDELFESKQHEEIKHLRSEVSRLTVSNHAVDVLKERNVNLEAQLEERTKDYQTAMEANRRLQSETKQEQEKCDSLSRKLEGEQRAAKRIGHDITKYVQDMKQLEQKVQTQVKEKTLLEEQLAKQDNDRITERKNFQQQLNELNNSTMISQNLQESNMLNNSSYLSAAAANETAYTNSVELCQTCHSGIGGVGEAAKKIKELALDLESQSSQNLRELRQKLHDLEVSNANLRSDLLVEQANHRQLQKDYLSCEKKLNEFYETRTNANTAQKTFEKIEQQNSWHKDITTNFAQSPLHEIFSPRLTEDHNEKPCSACCRKATEELEKKLKKTQLKLAEAKAERGTLISSEKKLIETLNVKKSRLEQTEEALNRLKTKSRTLLRQYRAKKQTLTSVSVKIELIRRSLLELKGLCKTKDDNYREILSHFGGQIEISARLLANYLNVPMNTSTFNVLLKPSSRNQQNLSSWFCDVQSLSTWTHAQLTAFGTRLWMGKEKSPEAVIKNTETITKKISTQVVMSNILKGEDESFSSKFDKLDAIQKQLSEADTMSELSHTLAYDGTDDESHLPIGQSQRKTTDVNLDSHQLDHQQKEYTNKNNPTAVKAIICAQDIIAKTQKEHFDNLLSVLGKSDGHI